MYRDSRIQMKMPMDDAFANWPFRCCLPLHIQGNHILMGSIRLHGCLQAQTSCAAAFVASPWPLVQTIWLLLLDVS